MSSTNTKNNNGHCFKFKLGISSFSLCKCLNMCCPTLMIYKILFIYLYIFLLQLLKKKYFLTLVTITVTGVSFIEKKITEGLYGKMPTNSLHLIIS